MIDNNEFMGLAAQMIKQYFEQEKVDTKDLGINLIDSASIGPDRKGLFGVNIATDTMFEIVFYYKANNATLKAFKIVKEISFDVKLNEEQ